LPILATNIVQTKKTTTKTKTGSIQASTGAGGASDRNKKQPEEADRFTNDLWLKLNTKLIEGQSYALTVTAGLKSPDDKPLTAKGTIKIPGAPTQPTPKLDVSLSSVAGVGQKAIFNLTANLVPLRPEWVNKKWEFDPSLAVDVGLRSTTSANSITPSVLFARAVDLGNIGPLKDPEPVDSTKGEKALLHYGAWSNAPIFKPTSMKFSIGGRAEFDQKLERRNVLLVARSEFTFPRLSRSIAQRKTELHSDLQDDVAFVDLHSGWEVVPYTEFDVGGHVDDQTLKNMGSSVLVPAHPIARSYAGLRETIEWRLFSMPMTLAIDESVVYAALSETIGFTTSSGVGLRRFTGLHHHGKASWNMFLDPSKHFSLTITYENGQSAPNFQYLNKVTSGFSIRFY
jgi:hypothetical protein